MSWLLICISLENSSIDVLFWYSEFAYLDIKVVLPTLSSPIKIGFNKCLGDFIN